MAYKWNEMTECERDALITERVMRLRENKSCRYSAMSTPYYYITEDGVDIVERNGEVYDQIPFRPSTDLSAAWKVMEAVTAELDTAERSYCEPHIRKHNNRWECYWLSIATASPPTMIGRSENVCHAICIAALRAVGVEVET